MTVVRRPSRQTVLVVLLLVMGALDLQTTAASLRAHARLRDRTLAAARLALVQARPLVASAAASGGPSAARAAATRLMQLVPAARVEAFTADRRRVAAVPDPGPDVPWPRSIERVLGGDLVTTGPVGQPVPRLVSHFAVPWGPDRLLLRVWSDAPDLNADLRDRQETFIVQAVTLLLLVAALALVLAPGRSERPSAPAGLVVYEEAMALLRAHGEERSRRHALERGQMEEELKGREALARAGELTAGMAHEVRNGLGTIVGYARLIEAAASAEHAAHARGIREECETLGTVVRRFMDFVRHQDLHLATFDLARMLRRVAARESRGSGTTVTVEAGADGAVCADEELLERVFENLVRNAREAAGPTGHVWVEARREGGSVTVVVSDDGPGMPAGVRAGLRPFFTTKPGGLGLGLAMALKIVRQHGGELKMRDRSPRGLSVEVHLPASGEGSDVTERNAGPEDQDSGPRRRSQ